MSEPIPESIPTSADPRSQRPVKRARGADTATAKQASGVQALFAHPDREIRLPTGPKAKTLAAPPEIVTNVQGSSAGAGSGEFHVYKASRRREYERLRLMDEETKKEEADKEFEAKRDDLQKRDAEKTSKNRARRQKQKDRQNRMKEGRDGSSTPSNPEGTADGDKVRSKAMKPMDLVRDHGTNGDKMAQGGEVKSTEEVGITFHEDD